MGGCVSTVSWCDYSVSVSIDVMSLLRLPAQELRPRPPMTTTPSSLFPRSRYPHRPTLPISHSSPSSLSPHLQQVPSVQPHSSPVLRNVEVSISSNFSDPLLRGNVGRLLSLLDHGLAIVFLYNLNQEVQVREQETSSEDFCKVLKR